MHLANLKLRDFRNYQRLDANFTPGFHLFLGDNAQGKTNILEAIYLLATLRSFRGVGNLQMVRQGQNGLFASGTVIAQGAHEIKYYWSARERKLSLDNNPIRKLTDYLGTLRAVVSCSEDLQLVKGSGQRRRRFMDLALSQTVPTYLPLLQRYMQALRSRNALLKQPRASSATLESFTNQLVAIGNQIISHRREIAPRVASLAARAYSQITTNTETFQLTYRPTVQKDFEVELKQSAAREKAFRATLIGPHRDDLLFTLDGQPAAQFASEGQKRSIAIALKMAQAELLTEVHGSPPILLIDDVMGELDARRRAGLLPLFERVKKANSQVFMTCTEENWPKELGANLNRWRITRGSLQQFNSVTRGSPQK